MTKDNKRSFDVCKQPNWQEIIKRCQDKIKAKYPQYGNSWVDLNDIGFWDKRLQGEVDEVKSVSFLRPDKEIEELLDVINVCAMRLSNLIAEEQKQHWHEVVMSRLGL